MWFFIKENDFALVVIVVIVAVILIGAIRLIASS
jgi:hypothetical protein